MKDIAGFLGVILMLATFILLIIKRRNLGKNICIFILAVGTITLVETYGTYWRYMDAEFNSYPVYVIGVSFILFLLFLLYLHFTLQQKRLRRLSVFFMITFLINYILSAIFFDTFLTKPPLNVYFGGMLMVTASIVLVLMETFNSEEIFSLQHYFPFWACIYIMVTYLGVTPLLIARFTAGQLNSTVFYLILLLVNILGYSVLLVGIFQGKNEN